MNNESLSLAIAKSSAMANTLPISVVDYVQECLGGDFEMSVKGLSVTPGAILSKEKLSSAMAFLAGASGTNKVAGAIINLALGDTILITRDACGDEVADELIQQSAKLRGQEKHTIQEAERTVRFINDVFPDRNEIPDGLYYSHFHELRRLKKLNGEWLVPEEKFPEIMQEVIKGHLVSSHTSPDSREIDIYQPKTTKETRELVNEVLPPKQPKQVIGVVAQPNEITMEEAFPSKPPSMKSQPTEKPIRFIYIAKDDHTDVVYSTDEFLDDDLLTDEFIILDVWCKEVLNPEKEAIAAFTEV